MRNWYNNLTPNLSISPSWFLAPLRSLTRQKNPWTCTSWPDGGMISVGNQFSRSVVSDSLRSHGLQHTRPPCPSLTPGACSNSGPLRQWCHPTFSSSVTPSPLALNLSQHQGLFQWVNSASGGQSIGLSASTSVLPMNIQDWFPLGWTGWISLQSKELSRVFSNTTVQKYQFFGAQFSL